ncbi:MAG: hypothetical protein JXR96_04705, partial [Deltaproteobacteria bacterium]|nr:hypothetical protein [Deltaproteobacteria bacterium]
MRSARAWCVFLLALLVLGACGTDDNACEDVSCGEHGSCDPETGACVCETGYHLDGDVCLEDECSADADCDDGL